MDRSDVYAEKSMAQEKRVSQQSETLLIMAMLLQDEDGMDCASPLGVARRIALLRLTEKRLRRCYDSVPRLFEQLSQLLDELFVTSNRYETWASHQHGKPADCVGNVKKPGTEWNRYRQKEMSLRQDFVQLLMTSYRALQDEVRANQPITGTRIVQDLIECLKSEPPTIVSPQAFRYAIRRLTRKYQSIRTILAHPFVAAFEAQSDEQAQRKMLNAMKQESRQTFAEVAADHAAFTQWAIRRNLPSDETGNFWVDAVIITWEKLRWGNFDYQYADSLTRLIATIAKNKVIQHFRDRPLLTNTFSEEYAPFSAEHDDWHGGEDDLFMEFEDQSLAEYELCAPKLGFDCMPNDNQQKSVLYFGFIVKYRDLIGDDERRDVESEIGMPPDSLTQQAISELLGLGITQGAVAHRLKGYVDRWYINIHAARLRLSNQADTAEKMGLVTFFQEIFFRTMTKKDEAPAGNESWYGMYARIRRQLMQANKPS